MKAKSTVDVKQAMSDVDIVNLYYNASFSSMRKACSNHDMHIALYCGKRSQGYSVEESYGIIKPLNRNVKNYVLFNGLTVQHHIKDEYFLCTLNNTDSILHHDDIIDYYRQNVLGYIINEKESTKRNKPVAQNGVRDHNQRLFKSIATMCEHYGISTGAYYSRIKRGWSKKKALTTPAQAHMHAKKEFSSESEMCKHYNIPRSTYAERKKRGWTTEECLSGKNKIKDHFGNTFASEKEMCDYYGVNYNTYCGRKSKGMPLEKCLLGIKEPVIDHLGQRFESVYDMCEHYGITYDAYRGRRRRGMNLEEILTFKDNVHRGEIYDHKGNRFNTTKDMLKQWGVDPKTYRFRRNNGWGLKECLEGKNDTIDHLGNTFSSEAEKCKHWNIQRTTYNARKRKGYIEEECLGLMPLINGRTFDLHVDSNLTIIRPTSSNNMFLCTYAGVEILWSREQIIDYYRKNIIDY